jgi:hypothetical protein
MRWCWFAWLLLAGCGAGARLPDDAGLRVVPTPADCPAGEACLVLAADDRGYDALCGEDAPELCSEDTADPSLLRDSCSAYHCRDCICFPCACIEEY